MNLLYDVSWSIETLMKKVYDDMLCGGKRICCIADGDCRSPETCCGGFAMIEVKKIEWRTITDTLEKGNFYSSYAPLIYSLWFKNGKIHINC